LVQGSLDSPSSNFSPWLKILHIHGFLCKYWFLTFKIILEFSGLVSSYKFLMHISNKSFHATLTCSWICAHILYCSYLQEQIISQGFWAHKQWRWYFSFSTFFFFKFYTNTVYSNTICANTCQT
jgi:hypothetical protein